MSQVLLSDWSKNAKSLPKQYIYPPESRLRDSEAPDIKTNNIIPVVDLSQPCTALEQIMKACQEFGAFQVINHGVPENLMDYAMNVCEEFFEMPAEDKEELYSTDIQKRCRLFTGGLNYSETSNICWKDTLQLFCFPLDDYIQSWPDKPSKFREIMRRYTEEVRMLYFKIMDMICQGLGIELGYFNGELSQHHTMFINYYPPCPDPSVAVGIPAHCDRNLITLLQQREYGFQVLKDKEWIGVEPIPHAFVVNVANQLEVISNGRLVSARHRAVTNSNVTRTSLVSFIAANTECQIEPAKALISKTSPTLFQSSGCNPFVDYEYGKNLAETSTDSQKIKF